MKNARQVIWGLGIGLVSVGLILGGLSLSLVEGGIARPDATLPPVMTDTWGAFPSALPDLPTPAPPTATHTPPPPPTSCPPPPGWLAYLVQPGDTLDLLAARFRISASDLTRSNCLLTTNLLPGTYIYVPPVPTATPVPCGPPAGWVTYIVRPGDNLYRISLAYGISVQELQQANCMGNSILIVTGQRLSVPPWATRTPSPTIPPTPSRTPTPTPTRPSPTATWPINTPTSTPSPTISPTSLLGGPATATPTPTASATSSATPSPTSP
ncbi:MAG: LysM peptidoglycan-binding domain-containing protein [Anaerolineales bacterium]|nr:LysM peptidoglycan-binding domain-containing protein [Anaerolineales bacterium]